MENRNTESIKGLKPKDFVSEARVDAAIAEWLPTRKPKSPIKDELVPILRRLMTELIIPSMDRDRHVRDEDEIFGNADTDRKKLYREITSDLGQARGVFYRTAKTVSIRLVDTIMEEHRNDKWREHKAFRPGDPEHTDPRRGVSGVGGSGSSWMDPAMHPNGYDQGIQEV